MRCFFNLVSETTTLVDEDGIDIDDIDWLYARLVKMLNELSQEDPSSSKDWKGWQLEVVDWSGRGLFSVDLGSILH